MLVGVGAAVWIHTRDGVPDRTARSDARAAASAPAAPTLAAGPTPSIPKMRGAPAPETGVVRVTVLHDSEPLPASSVMLRSDGGWTSETTTDAAGVAQVRDVPTGKVVVEARTGDALWVWGEIDVQASESASLALEAGPAARLTGRVVAAEDDHPLSGAVVCLVLGRQDWIRGRAGPCTTTGEDGRFAITWGATGLPWPEARLAATAPGREVAMVEVPAPTQGSGSTDLTVRLESGGSVRGTVRSRDGDPVAGAAVYLVSQDDETARTQPLGYIPWPGTSARALVGRTDQAGRFAIEGLAFGARYAALAQRSDLGRAVDVRGLWVSPDRPTVTVDLVFPRPSSLAVRVRHADGTVSRNFDLKIDDHEVSGPMENGARELQGLAPGTYSASVWEDGYLATRERIEVPEGARIERVLVLQKGISISGTVVDEQGEPLTNGWVREDTSPDGSSFHPVGDGKFAVSDVDAGPHRLTPTDGWRVPIGEPQEIEAPTSDVRLTTTGRQVGTVRLAAPAGFEVPQYMRVEWSDDGRPRRADSRSKDGTFRFGLMRGRTRLRFAPEGFLAFERVLDVPAGGRVDLGEVVLDPGTPLAGKSSIVKVGRSAAPAWRP